MAVNKTVSYADFKCLLEHFGFHVYKTPDPYWVFENPAYEAMLVLPFLTAKEPIRPAHLLTARMLIAQKGIASEADFDKALEKDTHSVDCVPIA